MGFGHEPSSAVAIDLRSRGTRECENSSRLCDLAGEEWPRTAFCESSSLSRKIRRKLPAHTRGGQIAQAPQLIMHLNYFSDENRFQYFTCGSKKHFSDHSLRIPRLETMFLEEYSRSAHGMLMNLLWGEPVWDSCWSSACNSQSERDKAKKNLLNQFEWDLLWFLFNINFAFLSTPSAESALFLPFSLKTFHLSLQCCFSELGVASLHIYYFFAYFRRLRLRRRLAIWIFKQFQLSLPTVASELRANCLNSRESSCNVISSSVPKHDTLFELQRNFTFFTEFSPRLRSEVTTYRRNSL